MGPESEGRSPGLQGDVRQAIDTWNEVYKGMHGTTPYLTKGKDPAIFVRLIRARGIDEVKVLIRGFLETGTKYARDRKAWTVGMFEHEYNALIAMRADGNL